MAERNAHAFSPEPTDVTTDAETSDRFEEPRLTSRMLRIVETLVRRTPVGSLDLTLPDGRRIEHRGAQPGPHAVVHVKDARFADMVLREGTCGLGEAYMAGYYETQSVAALVEWGARNREAIERIIEGSPVARTLRTIWLLLTRANSRRGSRRNIVRHYDLGNAFYERWLDPTMTYSSAVFDATTQDLAAAQENKYRHVARAGALEPAHEVLEIGCGWGGFASFAAREIGCRVTAITISPSQFAFASARVQREGLGERVEVRLQDYRDVEAGRFDRIASIEMFEAVGESYWPIYFRKLRGALKPGGVAALQVITIADQLFDSYRRSADFIQKHIFPGGMLPSPQVLREETARAGLAWRGDAGYGLDYARTLATWQERFQQAWPEIAPLGYDRRFKRMWEFYLAYCEGGFRAGSIDVKQVTLQRT
ncbi:MAG: class I SAM-dependent methyltransferase [Alphaproteobacteria bacterium]|nr:class I SAM-dependent methyltransferase [Alphaproteobacteria bacterium]